MKGPDLLLHSTGETDRNGAATLRETEPSGLNHSYKGNSSSSSGSQQPAAVQRKREPANYLALSRKEEQRHTEGECWPLVVAIGMRMEDSAVSVDVSVEQEVPTVTVGGGGNPEPGAAATKAAASDAGASPPPPAAEGASGSPSPPPVPEEKLEGKDLLEALKKQVLHPCSRVAVYPRRTARVYERFHQGPWGWVAAGGARIFLC